MDPIVVELSETQRTINLCAVMSTQYIDAKSGNIAHESKSFDGFANMLQVQMAYGWHVILKGKEIDEFLEAWSAFSYIRLVRAIQTPPPGSMFGGH